MVCNIAIVITDDGFFIFLTNITTVEKKKRFVRKLML